VPPRISPSPLQNGHFLSRNSITSSFHLFIAPAQDSAYALTGWQPESFVSPELLVDYCLQDISRGIEPLSLHPVLDQRAGIEPAFWRRSAALNRIKSYISCKLKPNLSHIVKCIV
jgi:hypothetical protein